MTNRCSLLLINLVDPSTVLLIRPRWHCNVHCCSYLDDQPINVHCCLAAGPGCTGASQIANNRWACQDCLQNKSLRVSTFRGDLAALGPGELDNARPIIYWSLQPGRMMMNISEDNPTLILTPRPFSFGKFQILTWRISGLLRVKSKHGQHGQHQHQDTTGMYQGN